MTPYLLTITWTIMALLADGAHIWSAADAQKYARQYDADERAGHHLNSSIRLIAQGNVWLSTSLAVIQTIDVLIGIGSIGLLLARPPTVPVPLETSNIAAMLGASVTFGLLLQEVCLSLVSIGIAIFRRVVRHRAITEQIEIERTKAADQGYCEDLVKAAAEIERAPHSADAKLALRRALAHYQGATS